MGKQLAAIFHDPRPRRPRLRTVVVVCIGLGLAPIIYESALICASRWKGMYGHYETPKTPMIEWVGRCWADNTRWTRHAVGVWFRDPAWDAGRTITLALGWAIAAAWLLRGGMRR